MATFKHELGETVELLGGSKGAIIQRGTWEHISNPTVYTNYYVVRSGDKDQTVSEMEIESFG